MGKRSFQAVDIVPLGVQSCEARFGRRRRGNDYGDWPRISQWRCNLNGLSQVHNLFFVAYSSRIFVYVPIFPTQELPIKPALIVESQASAPGLRGHINRFDPHAINSLVVQFLGYEEVVAIARDDGDVDAYLVRHIVDAISRRSGSSMSVCTDEVRPFFQENVGHSAWGLAIHSDARLIAISANSQKVTVFKLGFDHCCDEYTSSQELDSASPQPNDHRHEAVTRVVINGTCNIPHISFCNTGDDPTGRFLLTTDISGYCRTIDLDHMRTVQKFRFGHPIDPRLGSGFDRISAGWTIIFLDSRSFIPENDAPTALGLGAGENLPGIKVNQSIWDISLTVNHVQRAQNFVMRSTLPISRSSQPLGSTVVADDQLSEHISTHGSIEESIEDDDASLPIEDEIDVQIENEDDAGPDEMFHAAADSDSEDESIGIRQFSANEPRCDTFNDVAGKLPCPIFHASMRNVFLMQPSSQREPGLSPISSPTVGFTNALLQYVQADIAYINEFERLNMHAYIPAIGIIILASQKGRALILSLTKTLRSAEFPPGAPGLRPSAKRTLYAMRIEHIVPFESQEARNERPFAPLAGIAAGPMQGTEDLPDEKKRWRLLMMYTDHSVLSYEIRRQIPRTPRAQLESLVV